MLGFGKAADARRVSKRRNLKAKTPRVALETKHTERCRVLPDRLALLDRLSREGVVAEIGVAFGDFAVEILGRTRPKCLYLVDAWKGGRYESGLARIQSLFSAEIANGMVRVCQGYSTAKLLEFEDSFFDWVYLDTDHTFETTFKELVLCHRKVKAPWAHCRSRFLYG